jgi:hypothetical protein
MLQGLLAKCLLLQEVHVAKYVQRLYVIIDSRSRGLAFAALTQRRRRQKTKKPGTGLLDSCAARPQQRKTRGATALALGLGLVRLASGGSTHQRAKCAARRTSQPPASQSTTPASPAVSRGVPVIIPPYTLHHSATGPGAVVIPRFSLLVVGATERFSERLRFANEAMEWAPPRRVDAASKGQLGN